MANTIWVLVELEKGQPARSSLEVLGKAAQLGRAEAIVLGGTDLFLAFAGQDPGFALIDCADIHVDAIFQLSSS